MATTSYAPNVGSVCLRSMDIWYHTAASLDPPDIFALRATCSTLLMLCRQRSIWLQAVNTMCRSHGLFLPSFPLESMTVKELTRLALSPYTFSRLVSMEGEGRLPERQSRTFVPRLKGSESALEVTSLHLLPGGRYLLTYHDDDVCLWDLGYGPASPKTFPVASLHIENICFWYGERPPCPTEDGKGVRFVVLSIMKASSAPTQRSLRMYDICLASEEPAFRCIASWQVPSDSVILRYCSRYVVVRSRAVVQVYTVNDSEIDGPRCSLRSLYWSNDSSAKVAILGDTVLLSADSDEDAALNLFIIPRTPGPASATTQDQPRLVVPCSINGALAGPVYTSEWTAFSGNAYFALGGEMPDAMELQIYRMVNLASSTEPLLPSAMPVKVGEVSIPKWYNFIGGPYLQRLSSDLAVIGTAGGAVAVAKISIPQAGHDGLPSPSIKTLTDEVLYQEDDFVEEVSACVATGRLVVVHTDWVIRVIDYLSLD
ncbi:hypothetical protein BKA70DRAFT_1554267 [Coprinopsis sp. MPI-PUGE-AT-0042]|nr:hypothetical protein BKA70DRAFT_1554267 [Coprinopsis sp. MPI-PUGE-AT-0042]